MDLPPPIVELSPQEAEPPLHLSLRRAFSLLRSLLHSPPFSPHVSPSLHPDLTSALVFALLSQPQHHRLHLVHLHSTAPLDSYRLFTSTLTSLSLHLFPSLLPSPRSLLLSLLSPLARCRALGLDLLLLSLLRRVDSTPLNLPIAHHLLTFLHDHFELLPDLPPVAASGLFVYLRILADHYRLSGEPNFEDLKHLEVTFCVRVLRELFPSCLDIGRDLVRLLQDVTFVPELTVFWRDLLFNPAALCDISRIYRTHTPSHYFLLRVSPEMERQMRFLLTHVKWGSERRYLEWFARRFLCGPEQEMVIIDLVRFICCGHHPSNDILQSGVMPRWAVIGWLLKRCRRNYIAANAKLALFFDWLFFDAGVDNIMNIEPAMLLMVNSIPKHADMTCMLMEFLFILVDNYDVQRKDTIFRGVLSAFSACLKKGVVRSLEPLASCELISPALRSRMSVFISHLNQEAVRVPLSSRELKDPRKQSNTKQLSNLSALQSVKEAPLLVQTGDIAESTVADSVSVVPDKLRNSVSSQRSGFDLMDNLVTGLEAIVKESTECGLRALKSLLMLLIKLDTPVLDRGRREISSAICKEFAGQVSKAFDSVGYEMFHPLSSQDTEVALNDEIHSATALVIQAYIFHPHGKMRDVIAFWLDKGCLVRTRILSYACRLASEAKRLDGSGTIDSLQNVDTTMLLLQNHINNYSSFEVAGVQLHCNGLAKGGTDLQHAGMLVEGAFTAYRILLSFSAMELDLPNAMTQSDNREGADPFDGRKEHGETPSYSLHSDLLTCSKWGTRKVKELFPSVFIHLSDLSTSRVEFIQLLVEKLDYADLVSMQFQISLMQFNIFGKDPQGILKLVKCSLCWDDIQQKKLWGLLVPEVLVLNVRIDQIVNLCTDCINLLSHYVAVEGLFTLVRSCPPTPELINALVMLPDNFAEFTAATLACWLSSGSSLHAARLVEWLQGSTGVTSSEYSVKINHAVIKRLLNYFDKQYNKDLGSFPPLIPEVKALLSHIVEDIGQEDSMKIQLPSNNDDAMVLL